MADRVTPRPAAPRGGRPKRADPGPRTTIIVTRPAPEGLGDTPDVGGPFDGASPRDSDPNLNNRLASKPSERELTAHPADGPVPVIYGGPLRVGGAPIYIRRIGQYLYVDFGICEGPIESIVVLRCGDKTFSQLAVVSEVHLGVAGDTTSSMIGAFEPTYTIPEGVAHVACRFPLPNQTTGQYNPFDFTALVEGRVLYNPLSGLTEFNGFPTSAGWDILTNAAYGAGLDPSFMNAADWANAESQSEFAVDTGIPRWEFALRIDTQDTTENWLNVVLSYCHGHMRYDAGLQGVYLDEPQGLAEDNETNVVTFDDASYLTANTSGRITWTGKSLAEVPTVVVIDYTNRTGSGTTSDFLPASITIPEVFDPASDWVELRLSMPGIMTIERARRFGTRRFNVENLDKDITIPAWNTAWVPRVGERVRCVSRLLIGETETPPNANAIEGAEEVIITDIKLGASPVLRAGIYRDATYGELIDPTGPPQPPEPPTDPDSTPDCPTGLVAPSSDPSEYGMIEFFPPVDDSIVSYYRVYDIFTGNVLVGTVNPPGDPLGGDGKYHKSFPALVHVNGSGSHLAVRVDSVSFAGNVSTGCSTASWDDAVVVTGAEASIESAAYLIGSDGNQSIGNTTYDDENYSRVLAGTKRYSTTIVDPINDFFLIPSGNAGGIIVPKLAGQFHITATVGWAPDNDSTFRALAFFHLNTNSGAGGVHHTTITVDAGGTGYVSGEALTVTGGTLATGGFAFVGTVNVTAGAVTSISLTSYGIGYTSAPTIGVSTVGGSGAVLTAHLPAAFTINDLNFDCSGGVGSRIKGSLQAEDIVPAVNDATCPTRQTLAYTMSFRLGDGLLVGVQQNSGGNLNLLSDLSDNGAAFTEGCHLGIFRLPPAAATSDDWGICASG